MQSTEGSSLNILLVGGLEHEFYFPCHIWDSPSHWLIFFKMVIAPPSSIGLRENHGRSAGNYMFYMFLFAINTIGSCKFYLKHP